MNAQLKTIVISVIYWPAAIMFAVILRYFGMDLFLDQPLPLTFKEVSIPSIIGGVFAGIIWGLLEITDERIWKNKRRSFARLVGFKTIVYILIFFFISFVASWISYGSLDWAIKYLFSDIIFGNFVFFIVFGSLYLFIKQMSRMFGPGVLLQYVSGKYFNPKEEKRIFMFLDLKSSTSIAENLSHVRYSRLLQECFALLTFPVKKYKARIYQYVGDEAVITWDLKDGLLQNNCIEFYNSFSEQLKKKRDHFISQYGIFPEFKAGLSSGLVTVAEVGELKTEIAYHGDVLNTAARIQGYCNQLNESILLSQTLAQQLSRNDKFQFISLKEVQLRGKSETSEIFGVRKKSHHSS